MNIKENSQTAYQHNAHSSASTSEVNDHGWADAINRMIDQRYAFLALEYEKSGYLFRGMSSGLFNALLDNRFWHYSSEDRGAHFEKELDVLLVSQDFSDAFTVSKLWEQKLDACIIVFQSEIFNQALKENKAAMMATAEPGVVFKYPFLTHPLRLDDIEYLIISTDLLDAVKNSSGLNKFSEIDGAELNRLSSIIAEMHALDKLIIQEHIEENNTRSNMEKALIKSLLKREAVGAKSINSNIKPSRKM
jgi:hypothetical protein